MHISRHRTTLEAGCRIAAAREPTSWDLTRELASMVKPESKTPAVETDNRPETLIKRAQEEELKKRKVQKKDKKTYKERMRQLKDIMKSALKKIRKNKKS